MIRVALGQFAASQPENAGVLESLGIDWTLLAVQAVAFVVLVWALNKWVYPVFARILDERQAKIDASTKAADEAQAAADAADESVKELMKKARRDAAEIVSTARSEASAMVDDAEEKAKLRSETMIESARTDIANQMTDARNELRNEMVDLVEHATKKIIGSQADSIDKRVIKDALKESK